MATPVESAVRARVTRPADRWTTVFLGLTAVFAIWGVGLIVLTLVALATPGFAYPDQAKAGLKAMGATVVGVLALGQLYTMESVLGHLPRAGLKMRQLMRTHRLGGRIALALAVVIAYFCMVDIGAPSSPVRGFVHAIFGSTAFVAIAIKLVLIRSWPTVAYRLAPWLGRYAALAFVVVWLTSAYAFFTGTL